MANEPNIPRHAFYQGQHNRPNPLLSENRRFIDPELIPGNTIPPSSYTPEVVYTNGIASLLAVAGQMANSGVFELSYWFQFVSLTPGVDQTLSHIVNPGNVHRLRRSALNDVNFQVQDTTGASVYVDTDVDFAVDTLYHLYMSADITGAGSITILLNGVPYLNGGVLNTQNGVFDMAGNAGFVGNQAGANIMDAFVFDWYFKSGGPIRGYDAFQDNGNPNDISEFIDADVLMIGDAADWNAVNNAGTIALTTGGGFTDLDVPPLPFTVNDWDLDETSINTGELHVDLITMPESLLAPITNTYYSLDGGPQIAMGLTAPGRFTIRGLVGGQQYEVTVFAENEHGISTTSDIKSGVAAEGNTIPAPFQDEDWDVEDSRTGGEAIVTVITLPDDGGQPISDIEYSLDSGVYVSSGLSTTGSFVATGLVNNVGTDIGIRAVNSIGPADDGTTKSVTATASVATIVDNNSVGWLTGVAGQIVQSPVAEMSFWMTPNNLTEAKYHLAMEDPAKTLYFRSNNDEYRQLAVDNTDFQTYISTSIGLNLQVGQLYHVYQRIDLSVPEAILRVNGILLPMDSNIVAGSGILKNDQEIFLLNDTGGTRIFEGEISSLYFDTKQVRGYDAFHNNGAFRDISNYTDADILLTGDAAAWNAAVNEGVIALTVGAGGFTDVVVSTPPDAFLPADWSLSDVGDGVSLLVTVVNLPNDNGNVITDIEYELDASGTWVSTGLATVGQFTIGGLTTDQTYDVRLRAINAIGASDASSADTGTPSVIVPDVEELIYIGTLNNLGEGTYNSVYTLPWTDGTYPLGAGEVVVANGIGIFNGLQEVGTYVCANRTVEVGDKIWAAADQVEFRRFRNDVPNNSRRGFRLQIRKDCNNVSGWGGSPWGRSDGEFIVVGDQPEQVWDPTHFQFDSDQIDNIRNITIYNCSFKALTIKADVAWGDMLNLGIVGCRLGNNDPITNPPSDFYTPFNPLNPLYVESTSGGINGLWFQSNLVRGAGQNDNVLLWWKNTLMAIGNHCSKMLNDGWKIRGNDTPEFNVGVVGGNVFTEAFPSDTNPAHCDSFQLQSIDFYSGLRFEANMHAHGSVAEGNLSAPDYHDGPVIPTYEVVGVGVSCRSFNMYKMGNPGAGTGGARWMGYVPYSGWDKVGVLGNNTGRIVGNFQNIIEGAWYSQLINGVSDVTNSFSTINWNLADWDTNLPDWELLAERPTFREILTALTPAGGSVIDGMGPSVAVTLPGNAGTEVSNYKDYDIELAVTPNPVLSASSASGTTTTITGQVTTDTPHGFIKWAVIPSTMVVSVADWLQMVNNRLNDYSLRPDGVQGYADNAIEYWQTTDSTAGVHDLAKNVTLAPGDYLLLAIHIKGNTKRSALEQTPFTVT